MFFRRPLRLFNTKDHHRHIINLIKELGYQQAFDDGSSIGYCHGGAAIYTFSKLTGKMDQLRKWTSFLVENPDLAKHFKSITQKKAKNLSLSDTEKRMLENLPDDPRAFFDSIVLAQNPRLMEYQPFLLTRTKNQGDIAGLFTAIPKEEKSQASIVEIYQDARIHTKLELEDYLSKLAAIVRTIENETSEKNDYVFSLASSSHYIAITPSMHANEWEMFELNQLPDFAISKDIGAEVRLALLTAESHRSYMDLIVDYTQEQYTAYSIKIFTLGSNPHREKASLQLKEFRDSPVNRLSIDTANRRTRHGVSLLGIASFCGIANILEQLAPLKINLNEPFWLGRTALAWAARNDCAEGVQALLTQGADPFIADDYGYTPLINASISGYPQCVRLLIKAYQKLKPALINAEDKMHGTALFRATFRNHIYVVKLLLDNGACPSIAYKDKTTPLMIAASLGYTTIVELIAQKFKRINRVNSLNTRCAANYSAAIYAAKSGHAKAIKILNKYGADLYTSLNEMLLFAIENEYISVIETLHHECKLPIDTIRTRSTQEEWPSSLAAVNAGKVKVIRCFAELGFDFTAIEPRTGLSAITFAIKTKNWAITARMLMSIDKPLCHYDCHLIEANKDEILLAHANEKKFAPKEKENNYIKTLININKQAEEKINYPVRP